MSTRTDRVRFASSFGLVSRQERRQADWFLADLLGVPANPFTPTTFTKFDSSTSLRGGRARRWECQRAERFYEALTGLPGEAYEEPTDEQTSPPPPQQQPYLPAGGRNFVPQQGVFNCAPTPFLVVAASFLPERTTNPNAAIDGALTAAGLDQTQRRRVTRAGLLPIATEFGAPALTELFARLRWSADDISGRGRGADSILVPRLLIHIPGHFRELARRAPNAGEAFLLECIGWLLMGQMQRAVAGATRKAWWVPPAPTFVTAAPNPIPPVSAEVAALLTRYLLIDTTMTASQWNNQLVAWGTSRAGRQWQAEVSAPQPGRPFYAGLVTIPAHVNTAAQRASFATAWTQRLADTDARHTPAAAGAASVTIDNLRNAIELRQCDNGNPNLPAGAIAALGLQGLELAPDDFPQRAGLQTITRLPLMAQLHPIYTALFAAIRELGWNDLLYQTSGGACFRGIKHPPVKLVIGGKSVLVNPFNASATTVTQINNLSAADRAQVVAAMRAARTLSEHGLGAAIDFNVPENSQAIVAQPFGSMDQRVVAIFEAFHFRWGACFTTTDPMHFEYCQTPCAPAAASAGNLGPVVTKQLLLPVQATGRVIA